MKTLIIKKMKIRNLIKYSVLPVIMIIFYLSSNLITRLDNLGIDDKNIILFSLLLVFFILASVVLLFLTLFAFFKKSEIPILIFTIAIFINSILTLILIPANSKVFQSISEDSEILTSLLLFYLAIGFFVFALRSSSKIKGNRFLVFLYVFGGLVFTFDFIYFGLKLMDPELGTRILMPVSIGLFLVFSFILIFSLPNSDYMEWKKDHRQLFLKTILVPWVLILYLSFMNFIVSPKEDLSKEKTSTSPAFGMKNYEITLKDGMD
jgi:hypothetical protein